MTHRMHPSWCSVNAVGALCIIEVYAKDNTGPSFMMCHIFSLSTVVSSWQPWIQFDCWSRSARLCWKSSGSCRLPQCWCALPFLCGCLGVCLHAHLLELHGRREPCWVIDNWLGSFMMEISALLCHIFPAVALLTLRNEAEFSSSLILSELRLEYKKSPGDYYLLTFSFWSVWAKVKWSKCRKQASRKVLFFRKNLRNLWFSATNKGFNWKNAESTVRKGRFCDVLKQNT